MVITFRDCDICKKRYDSSDREYYLFSELVDFNRSTLDVCCECTEHLYATRHPGHKKSNEPELTTVQTAPGKEPVWTHFHDGTPHIYSVDIPCPGCAT